MELKMMKRILLGACAVVLLAGIAMAQAATNNDNPPPPPPQDQQANGPDSGDGGWFSGYRHGRHHGERGGPMQNGADGGGPGMRMDGKGFGIMVGPGHGLHVNCGNEPMKDCIASAQPLIEALGKLDFKMPPPPAGAVPPAQ
jgi:opacity protein-like surface antigen